MTTTFYKLQNFRKGIIISLLLLGFIAMGNKASASCATNLYYKINKLTVSFSDSGSTGLSHPHRTLWKFGDSTKASTDNPSHTYTDTGTYYIIVSVYDSVTTCLTTNYAYIYISNCTPLTAAFTYTISGRTVSFKNTGSSSSTMRYFWQFGDGSVDSSTNDTITHTYTGTQNQYSVSLFLQEGNLKCRAYSSQNILLCNALSTFYYSENTNTFNFRGDSTNASSVAYAWKFGDGDSGTGIKTSHTYKTFGNHHVCLIATAGGNQCSSTTCYDVKTTTTCTANIYYKINRLNVDFSDSGSTGLLHPHSTLWKFGDSTTALVDNPSHTYTDTGYYYVRVSVYDSVTTCISTNFSYIYISNCIPLTSSFTYKISGRTVLFKNTGSSSSTMRYFWQYGDGSIDSSANDTPSHTYAGTQNQFSASLIIREGNLKCGAYSTQNILLCNALSVYYYYENGNTIKFIGDSTNASTVTYAWKFGDGDSGTGIKTTHSYNTFGNHNVCLTATAGGNQCSSITCYDVKTTPTCTTNLYYSSNKLTVSFSDSGSTGLSHLHRTFWAFGDGTTDTTDNPTHNYADTGTYNVQVTVRDTANGCSNTNYKQIYVSNCNPLTASFTYTISGRTVSFKNTGSSSSTMRYFWQYGDGNIDSAKNDTPVHIYAGTQNQYSVSFYIQEGHSKCSAYSTQNILLCNALSSFSYILDGNTVKFTGDSTNASTVTYNWKFGDGDSGSGVKPSHIYKSFGKFNVCLTATASGNNCSSTTCNDVIFPDTTSCIYGRIYAGSSLVAPCMVYLISFSAADSSLTAQDSIYLGTDSLRDFQFCGLQKGIYFTKAALMSGNTNYSKYVPTYHTSGTKWKSADSIIVGKQTYSSAIINMQTGSNTGGPGFIGGKISAGANKVGDPEAGILVILYDSSGSPTAYAHTDADGNYSMSNLAYGTYSLEVEIPGKACTPSLIVLNAANEKDSGINYSVNIKTITPIDKSGIQLFTINKDKISVYPNPVNDKLLINTNLQTSQDVSIEITDLTGKIIISQDRFVANNEQVTELDASSLHNGIYFVKIQLLKDLKTLKTNFVKAQ